MLNVTLIPILSDNYTYILQSENDVAVLDPGESTAIINFLEEKKLIPSIIFNTHHHYDHIDGNAALKKKYGCKIIAPEKERHRIGNIDQAVSEGDIVTFGDEIIEVMETPGHTSGHICLWAPKSQILFSGDTLFSMGCGRVFDGTVEELFESFQRLKKLPDNTRVYCAHEYTQNNGEFCLSMTPDDPDLIKRMEDVQNLRQQGIPTIPTNIGLEKKTNVFMKATTFEEFKKYRKLKDKF